MLEKIIGSKRLVGLAMIASVGLGMNACGEEDCQTNFESSTYALMGEGESVYKQEQSSPYETKRSALGEDGCPSGCTSISDTCCWCSY